MTLTPAKDVNRFDNGALRNGLQADYILFYRLDESSLVRGTWSKELRES